MGRWRTRLRRVPGVGRLGHEFLQASRVGYARVRRFRSPTGGVAVTPDEARAAGAGGTEIEAMFFEHQGRQIHKWTHYFEAYEEHFGPYRNGLPQPDGSRRPVRILEIGVADGGSLQLWRRYFGPDAGVWGIDVDPACAMIDDPDVEIRIGSQDDRYFLEGVVSEMGGVDIVLDDGSHIAKHQRRSFEVLFPLLSEGGLYAVEDLHTSYWSGYEGGYRRRGTFIEVVKDVIDDMHFWHHVHPMKRLTDARSGVSQLCLYDSIVFLHKAPIRRPMDVKVGH